MASESRRRDSPVISQLFEQAYRFEFFQAVRLLERIYADRRPVGLDNSPLSEAARFRTRVSLGFPPSQVYRISPNGHGDGHPPPEVEVAFMGMTGPMGLLPHPYTELLIDRTRYRDTALWEFLDIFNHRMISLFYRAWEKHHFTVAYERNRQDPLTEHLLHIAGIGAPALRGRQSFPDQTLIFYGGLVAQRPHSATAIESALSDYFGVPAVVEQFSGQWLKLDQESITRLGSANSELGVSMVAGSRVWDVQSKFRLRLGPLTLDEFNSFLPVGSAFKQICDLTRLLAGLEFDFDVQLVLKADEVPRFELSTRAGRQPMLGWTSWLASRPASEDDSQVVLNPDRKPSRSSAALAV